MEIVEEVAGQPTAVLDLLEALDTVHELHDSRFAAPHRLTATTEAQGIRLVALVGGRPAGFLTGDPRTGHIALIGVLNTRCGIGTALLDTYLQQARARGARQATVVLDTEPSGRWQRRRFFEANGFAAVAGSALHFHRSLLPPD